LERYDERDKERKGRKTMKVKASWVRNLGGMVKEIFLTILAVWFGCGFAVFIIDQGSQLHAVAGAVAALVISGLALAIGIRDLRSLEARGYSIWKGLRIFLLMILMGAVVFGEISFLLATVGWAKYEPEGVSFYVFAEYYIMTLVDLLPGLEVSETLDLRLPVKPDGLVAGLPVLLFRAFVIFGVLATFRIWWIARGSKEENGEHAS